MKGGYRRGGQRSGPKAEIGAGECGFVVRGCLASARSGCVEGNEALRETGKLHLLLESSHIDLTLTLSAL